ncbi:MAG: MBL fold metallo-hydrolase [Deltaproteobacteria bacterium]|nr:MAG: MBL fold metallo-hydrolase [Deltaproteobacteria bacterium]
MFYRTTFAVGALQCNCSIIGDTDSGEAVVIDPGDEVPRIIDTLFQAKLRAVAIVHTHAHIDHIGGATRLAQVTGAKTYLHGEDTFLYDMLGLQAQLLGLPPPAAQRPIDRPLLDEMAVPFGDCELGVMHTPGHTPGSVCFVVPRHDLCFAGDTLFQGSIGRTDLPGGDPEAIRRSIRNRIYSLSGDAEVICGHGPSTTVAKERRHNAFVRA